MSIAKKVYLMVGAIILLMIAVTGVGLYGISALNELIHLTNMYSMRSDSVSGISFVARDRAVALRDVILVNTPERLAEAVQRLKKSEDDMKKPMEGYAATIPADASEDLKAVPGELQRLWDNYVAETAKAADTSQRRTNSKAWELFFKSDEDWNAAEKSAQALPALMDGETDPGVVLLRGKCRMVVTDIVRLRLLLARIIQESDAKAIEKIKIDIQAAFDAIDAILNQAIALNRDGITAHTRGLMELGGRIRKLADDIIPLAEEDSNDLALTHLLNECMPAYEKLDKLVNERIAIAQGMQETYMKEAISKGRFLMTLSGVVAIVGVFFGAICAWLVIRGVVLGLTRISEGLGESSTQVASAAGMISSSSQGLAEGATEQAASLEETSSALEQMASMTRQNADNANRTNQTTTQTVKLITEGAKAIQSMSQAMGEINDSAEKIGRIIKTIEEIAFQTNLLALNAAVEAARAGEAGKGFAVVADEVRNLAQRSAQAARDTATLIEGTVARVRNGSGIAERLESSFTEIDAGAKDVGKLIVEITTATNEQAQGVDQVNTAVAQMDKVTQQNAASAEECASASEELLAQAEALKQMVEDMVAVVTGARRAPAAGFAPPPRPAGSPPKPPARRAPGATPMGAAPRRLAAPLPDSRKVVMKPNDVIPLDGDADFKDF